MRRSIVARAGGALGGLAVIVVVIVMATGPHGGSGSDTSSTPADWSRAQRLEYWKNTLVPRSKDIPVAQAIDVWKSNHAWAEDYLAPQQAEMAIEMILKLDPQASTGTPPRSPPRA